MHHQGMVWYGPSSAFSTVVFLNNSFCYLPLLSQGKGFRFNDSNMAVIRFACIKGFLEVQGTIVDDTTIEFETPNFEKFGPVEVECRVAIGSKSLTNSTTNFSFFSVGNANTTVAFGPGTCFP